MNSANVQVLPSPPSLIKSILAGFDAVSNHVSLIVFSVCLDLFLWLGPRLSLSLVLKSLLGPTLTLVKAQNSAFYNDFILTFEALNLFRILRTFPVGIPSLMAARSPAETPVGASLVYQIPSLFSIIVLWFLLLVAGVCLGTYYFIVVSQASLGAKIDWKLALQQWPRCLLQIGLLTSGWLALLASTLLGLSCLLSILLFTGLNLEQLLVFSVLIFGGIIIWLLIPFIFSPHGIIAYQFSLINSIKESFRITRMTLPSTSLLFLIFIVLSQGLDILWNIPEDHSWFLLIGVGGHAFVATSLLAASFIYYRDAASWLHSLVQAKKLSQV